MKSDIDFKEGSNVAEVQQIDEPQLNLCMHKGSIPLCLGKSVISRVPLKYFYNMINPYISMFQIDTSIERRNIFLKFISKKKKKLMW